MATTVSKALGNPIKAPSAVAIVLAVVTTAAAIGVPDFLARSNLTNIGIQTSILMIIALPMTLIIMTEGIDISMGAVLSLCGVVIALSWSQGASLLVAATAGVLTGAAFGLLNGFLIAQMGLPAFVVTLGTFGLAQGLALALSGGSVIRFANEQAQFLYSGSLVGIPIPIAIAVFGLAATYLLLRHTRFGAYVVALGGNREALALAGVRVRLQHGLVYLLGGFVVGLTSILMTARLSAGHPTVAIGMEFDAIAAVVLGGTSFERGKGRLFGTALGTLVIGVVRNSMNLLAIESSLQVVSIGLLVLGVILLQSLRNQE